MKTIIKTLILGSFITTAYAGPKALWQVDIDKNNANLLTSSINSKKANTNKETVSYSYKLDQTEKLNFDIKPFIENSKQYWIDSTGSKLSHGISLPVSGGDTVIRISPLTNDKSVQIEAHMVKIQNNGTSKTINVFADSAQLKATGAAFSENSIAMKVSSDAGKLNLKVANSAGNTPFVVHVLEPKSDYVLSLKASQPVYNVGQKISINSHLLSGDKKINTELQGYISRPDGSVLGNLDFTRSADGKYEAKLDAISPQGLVEGLWEVHVFAKGNENGIEIMRDAQTSFAVNLNSAKFNDTLQLSENKLKVGVQVGLEGRYEVRGILMGTDAQSLELKPIAMTMSASWLKAGPQSINLPIDNLLKESGLVAPFKLMNVQLTNQTFMAPVQKVIEGIKLL